MDSTNLKCNTVNFKTKKGTYKTWKADTKNLYAYNVETKEELIVDLLKFDKWVRDAQIEVLATLIEK